MRPAPKRDEHHMPAVVVCIARLYISLDTIPLPDLNNTATLFHHHIHFSTQLPPTLSHATTTHIAPLFNRRQQNSTLPTATAHKPKVTLPRVINPVRERHRQRQHQTAYSIYSTPHTFGNLTHPCSNGTSSPLRHGSEIQAVRQVPA